MLCSTVVICLVFFLNNVCMFFSIVINILHSFVEKYLAVHVFHIGAILVSYFSIFFYVNWTFLIVYRLYLLFTDSSKTSI